MLLLKDRFFTGSILMPRNESLEKILLQNPNNKEAWLVYADWLSSQGDVRGEIIALENQDKKKNKSAVKKLLKEHQEAWLNPVASEEDELLLSELDNVNLTWKNGFLETAQIFQAGEPEYNDEGYDYYGEDGPGAEKTLEALLNSEAARFLHTLEVQLLDANISKTALVKPGSASLRQLTIGDPNEEWISPTSLGPMTALAKSLPNLEGLTLRGQGSALSLGGKSTRWPKLKELTIQAMYLEETLWKSLASVMLPKLEQLSVDMVWSSFEYGEANLAGLSGFLSRTDLPQLKVLGIHGSTLGSPLLQQLLDSPLLPRLTELRLMGNDLGKEGAELLLENLDRFRHLKVFNVDYNNVPDVLATKLRKENWIECADCNEGYDPEWN
jgi:uncharacterized protein (TIGR02996 family)